VTTCRTIAVLLVVGAVMMLVLGRASHARAVDQEEEKAITSSAARISRDAAGNVVVALGPAAQKETGITTEILKAVVRPVEVEAYGFVLDPAPLSKLNADLKGAQAALDSSSSQYQRTRRLYAEQKNASLRDLQSAEATYLNDKARVEALEQQLRDAWGRQIAQIDSRARGELVSALIDRREAIARVTAPIGEALDKSPSRADVSVLGRERQPLQARALYEAPTINPQMQGQTFLLLISTQDFPIRPGTAVSAALPTSAKSEQGVMVPRAAVVRFAGREWIYREFAGDRFARREIVPAQLAAEGYFVTEDLAAGTRIVVTGAQTLLSEELKAQIQPED
jgi:membrane fusion protein, multidrug efflux system